MAVKKVTAEVDGVKKTFTLDVPDGATNDDIAEAISSYHDTGAPKVLAPPPGPSKTSPPPALPWMNQVQQTAPAGLTGALPQNLQPLPPTQQQAAAALQGQDQTGKPTGSLGALIGQGYTNMADAGMRGAQGTNKALPYIAGALAPGGAEGLLAKMGLSGAATGAASLLSDLAQGNTPDPTKAAVAGGGMAAGEGLLGGTGKLLNMLGASKALSQVGTDAAANASSLSKQVVDNREQAAILRKMFQKDFAKTADGIEAAHNQKILDAQKALDLVNSRLESEPTDLGKQLLRNRKQDLTTQIRELKTVGPSLPPPEQFPSYAKWQEAKTALAKAKMDKIAAVHQGKIATIQSSQLPTKDILKILGIAGAGAAGTLAAESAIKHLVP